MYYSGRQKWESRARKIRKPAGESRAGLLLFGFIVVSIALPSAIRPASPGFFFSPSGAMLDRPAR